MQRRGVAELVGVLACASAVGLLGAVPSVGVGVQLLVVFALTVGWLGYATASRRYVTLTLTIAFLARLLLVVVDLRIGLLFEPPIADQHTKFATKVARGWLAGDPSANLGRNTSIPVSSKEILVAHLYAPFYVIFGLWAEAGRLATATYGTLVGYPVYRIADSIAETRTETLVATGAVLFWPSILVRSVVIQRETLILLGMMSVVWIAVRWVDRVQLRDGVVLLSAVWLVRELRPENLLLVCLTFSAVLGARLWRSRGAGVTVTATLVAGLCSVGLFVALPVESVVSSALGISSLSPANLDQLAYKRARGDATYLIGVHYRSWWDVLLLIPVKVLYYLGTPFPWHITDLEDVFAGVSGWGLLATVGSLPSVLRYYLDDFERVFPLLVYFSAGVTTYAIVEMNYGAAFRRRIQFVPVVITLVSIVLARIVTVRYRPAESSAAHESAAGVEQSP